MPKVTLIPVAGNSYICSGFLSIGVYITGSSATLIDSGGDESCAKDVSNGLEAAGYTVSAIINTHCHPDHCGGNTFFQKKYPGIKIYAAHDEQRFIEDPALAPRCFSGQAEPFSGLLNKYIAPQKPSTVTDPLAAQDQMVVINGSAFKIIALPGHTPGSIGIITPDNVLYAGDALFGEDTFRKHAILFYTNIGATLTSLKKLETLQINACALYHGGIIKDLAVTSQAHQARILETKQSVLELLKNGPLSVDQVTQKIMQRHAISDGIVFFVLTQTAMRAYLALLEQEKLVTIVVRDGLLQAIAA